MSRDDHDTDRRRGIRTPVLAILAVAGTLLVYGNTLAFGFRYDDYHVLTPWTAADLLYVMHGNWDPTGIESKFYRPLTAWWYALRFWLFGLNAYPQHVVTIIGSAICAFLAGLFVWREVRRVPAALCAAGLYAIYPPFVYSQALWLTNQMHLWASLTVLSAMIVWQRARTSGGAAWWVLLALQVVAFGFKEDTIMLLPAVVLLTAVRAWLMRDVRLPSSRVMMAALLLVIALPVWRSAALEWHLGGYGRPGFERGWSNLMGIVNVFLERPAKRPWQAFTGDYSAILVIGAVIAAALRRQWRSLHLLFCGVIVALAFNLPFYLVSKGEQYHLVALGLVLTIAGALDTIHQRWPGRRGSGVACLVMLPAIAFVPVTRNLAGDFAPCSPITLGTDRIVETWAIVPEEIRAWLRAKPDQCRAGTVRPLTTLPVVVWARGRETDETGAAAEWTTDRALLLFSMGTPRVNITVRTPIAAGDAPSTVRIESGSSVYTIVLSDGDWHTQTIRFTSGLRGRLAGMSRVSLRVSPTFVPDERFHNGDRRVLGVLMKVPE